MSWARLQPTCIQRDWNDRRKFMGHFPECEYAAELQDPPLDVIHQVRFAPAAGSAAEALDDGYWHHAVIKNNSRADSVDLLVMTYAMADQGYQEAIHITILPKGIKSLSQIHLGYPMEVVSLGAEAELEIVLIGQKAQVAV